MSLGGFFVRTAFNHLRRGEQRALAALLCITFGVMSLVAMSLVADAMRQALDVPAPELIGADLSLERAQEDYIGPEHAASLEAMAQAGEIERYLLVAYSSNIAFRRPDSGEVFFANSGLGIDPAQYPLAGRLTIGAPAQASPAALLQAPGDVLLTRDLAEAHGVAVGDTLLVSSLRAGTTVTATVRGLVYDTPNHMGSRLYYTLPTAEQLAGHNRVLTVALVQAPNPEALASHFSAQGWFALAASSWAQSNASTASLFNLTLKGAGVLGLLVGGIGIASTMQVLLRRRQREIAIWKTLGYRAGQLQAMFALEAALLGAAGSLVGAGLGVLVSRGLLGLLLSTGNLLINWSFSPWAVAAGALTGLVTTVIFALWAIVRAAQTPPMALLRQESAPAPRATWLGSAALAVVLAVPFALVTMWVMGSVWQGLGVLLFAVAGLVVLGALLGGLAWAAVRLLGLAPASLPLVVLAQGNLRRRGLSLVFGMIALFTGIVALALGVVVTQNGQREMAERAVTLDGPELSVLGAAHDEAAMVAAAEAAGLDASTRRYETSVQRISVAGQTHSASSPLLIGATEPGELAVFGAPWGSQPEGVYVNGSGPVAPGGQVAVTLHDGTVHTLTVVGTYAMDFAGFRPRPGLLLPAALSQQLAPPETVQLDLEAPASQTAALTRRLGQALPQATVINRVAYASRFLASYRNLFLLAVAMSGLALLAGVLLVGNAVSLAMLDRRYELGVLKAIGYTRRHLLASLLLEYGLIGIIATGAALAGVQMMLWLLGAFNDLASQLLVLAPASVVVIALTGVGLVLLAVVAATWRPAQASPAVVLNDRE